MVEQVNGDNERGADKGQWDEAQQRMPQDVASYARIMGESLGIDYELTI